MFLALFDESGKEIAAASYRRAPVHNTRWLLVPEWPDRLGIANVDKILFPRADEPWGLLVSFALYAHAKGGEPILRPMPLASRQVIPNSGLTCEFLPGALTLVFSEDK